MKTQDWLIIGAAVGLYMFYPTIKSYIDTANAVKKGTEKTMETVENAQKTADTVVNYFGGTWETLGDVKSDLTNAAGDAYADFDAKYFNGWLPGGAEGQTPPYALGREFGKGKDTKTERVNAAKKKAAEINANAKAALDRARLLLERAKTNSGGDVR